MWHGKHWRKARGVLLALTPLHWLLSLGQPIQLPFSNASLALLITWTGWTKYWILFIFVATTQTDNLKSWLSIHRHIEFKQKVPDIMLVLTLACISWPPCQSRPLGWHFLLLIPGTQILKNTSWKTSSMALSLLKSNNLISEHVTRIIEVSECQPHSEDANDYLIILTLSRKII